MKKIIILFLVPIIMLYPTTYYLSNIYGDDNYNGTSETTPWKTITKLNTALQSGIPSGSIIKFQQGSEGSESRFYGQINLTGTVPSNLTFTSYPDTDPSYKPVIDGSISQIELSSFSLESNEEGDDDYYVCELDNIMPNNFKIINVAIGDTQFILARTPNVYIEDDDIDTYLPKERYDDNIKTFYKISNWDATNRIITAAADFTDDFEKFRGATFVSKECKSWYDIDEILSSSDNNLCYLPQNTGYYDYKNNYGFFIQDDINALDKPYEWYYEYDSNKLYLHKSIQLDPTKKVYITGYKKDDPTSIGNGFYITPSNGNKGYTIKNLTFQNMRECIMIGNSFTNTSIDDYINDTNLTIDNCDFINSFIGIDNYANNTITISNNTFKNMNVFGILCYGEDITIISNEFVNIGLLLGYDLNLFWRYNASANQYAEYIPNLVAIQTHGSTIDIIDNTITNVGYSGIKYFAKHSNFVTAENTDKVTDINIYDNTITNALHSMSDGGGIYSHTTFGVDSNEDESKNVIELNKIYDCMGNSSGTDRINSVAEFDAPGVYLDELACNVKINDNIISNCASGILAQSGWGYEITGNTISNSAVFDIQINHGGQVLNGGSDNDTNDINYSVDPNTNTGLLPSNSSYYWNKGKKTLQIADGRGKYVYSQVCDNIIKDNFISTSNISAFFYNFIFKTWKEVNENTLYGFTSNVNPVSNNISGIDLDDVSVFISSSDLSDTDENGVLFVDDVGKVSIDQTNISNLEYYQVGKLNMRVTTGEKVK